MRCNGRKTKSKYRGTPCTRSEMANSEYIKCCGNTVYVKPSRPEMCSVNPRQRVNRCRERITPAHLQLVRPYCMLIQYRMMQTLLYQHRGTERYSVRSRHDGRTLHYHVCQQSVLGRECDERNRVYGISALVEAAHQ